MNEIQNFTDWALGEPSVSVVVHARDVAIYKAKWYVDFGNHNYPSVCSRRTGIYSDCFTNIYSIYIHFFFKFYIDIWITCSFEKLFHWMSMIIMIFIYSLPRLGTSIVHRQRVIQSISGKLLWNTFRLWIRIVSVRSWCCDLTSLSKNRVLGTVYHQYNL